MNYKKSKPSHKRFDFLKDQHENIFKNPKINEQKLEYKRNKNFNTNLKTKETKKENIFIKSHNLNTNSKENNFLSKNRITVEEIDSKDIFPLLQKNVDNMNKQSKQSNKNFKKCIHNNPIEKEIKKIKKGWVVIYFQNHEFCIKYGEFTDWQKTKINEPREIFTPFYNNYCDEYKLLEKSEEKHNSEDNLIFIDQDDDEQSENEQSENEQYNEYL